MTQNTVRLSLDITPEGKQNLQRVQAKGKHPTIVDVFRKSLAVYELILDHQTGGGKLILEGPDGTREVLRLL